TTPGWHDAPPPPAVQPFAAQSFDCEHGAVRALESAHFPQAGRVGSGSPPSVRVATIANTVRPMSHRAMQGSLLDSGDWAKDRAAAHTHAPPPRQSGSSRPAGPFSSLGTGFGGGYRRAGQGQGGSGMAPVALADRLARIPDPRQDSGKRHP